VYKLAFLVMLGCGGGAESPAGAPPPRATAEPVPAEPVPGEPAPHDSADIVVTGMDASGRLATTIENRSSAAIELRRALRLDREEGAAFVPFAGVEAIWIRPDCEVRDGVVFWAGGGDECVTVAPGETFEAPAWFGTIGDAQCACERCVPAPSGRYRLSARACGTDVWFEGTPFELGAAP
jgi:hypothetical protein